MDLAEQYDKVFRYCFFKLHDESLAEDITQETFLHFYKKDLSLDNSKELPYLYTIAKNLCIDEFRKKSVKGLEVTGEDAAYDPSNEWIDTLALRSVMAKLPEHEQELLFLRYANEISISSICTITGLSRFAVHRRLSKALKWLKEELKREEFFE